MCLIPSFIVYISLNCINAQLWTKHYFTYSIENETKFSLQIYNAISDWNVSSLEFKETISGDIKIYFVSFKENALLGRAFPPPIGMIYINKNINGPLLTKVVQHEFCHALGLKHNTKDILSIMYPYSLPISSITKNDRDSLNNLYKCRYDSVTLLNYQTYLKFRGRQYNRIDLMDGGTTSDKLWHPSILKVDAMYRNNTYVILSNDTFYEFDHKLKFILKGNIKTKFPGINSKITAVLTFPNKTILTFLENNEIWYNGIVSKNIWFRKGTVQGAYMLWNRNIVIVIKDYMYVFDINFTFIEQKRMCDEKFTLGKIHCCNDHSNQ